MRLIKLREFCEVREYKEVAHLISAIDEFFIYFKQYNNIAQIQSIIKEKDALLLVNSNVKLERILLLGAKELQL